MAEGFNPVGINAGIVYNSDPTSRISNFTILDSFTQIVSYLQALVPVYTQFSYIVVLGPYSGCWGSLLGPYFTKKKLVLIGSLSQSLGVFISFRDSVKD